MKNSLWMIFPLVLILIGVCAPMPGEAAGKNPGGGSSSARTVIDSAGRAVKIPSAIRRVIVTCYGGAAHEVSVLGGADKIVAQPSDRTFRQFHRMYPALDGACDAGSFDNINLEKILSLKPDMVIAGVVSPQGNEKIESLGIPVFTVAVGRADIPTLLREFREMGTLLGAEETAAELVSYWRRTLNLIEERVATVPVAKRKSVFYTSHGVASPLVTGGRHSWGHHFISAGGGINVAASLGFSQELTVEQLLLWNPDVIVVSNTRTGQSPVSAILASQKLKKVKAVKKGAVYPCPVGAFWWDRPSPEAILGILWLSMKLYPEVMEDIDLSREVRCFYRKFHGYELTDAELQSFF